MKSFRRIKEELKSEMINRGWNHTLYCDVAEFFMRFIQKEFYGDLAKTGKKYYYELCPKCNKRRGIYRVITKDYRCRECKNVFKVDDV